MKGVSGSFEMGGQGLVTQPLSRLGCVFVRVLAAADLLWLQQNVCLGVCCINVLF